MCKSLFRLVSSDSQVKEFIVLNDVFLAKTLSWKINSSHLLVSTGQDHTMVLTGIDKQMPRGILKSCRFLPHHKQSATCC